jgi:hypothetical protein
MLLIKLQTLLMLSFTFEIFIEILSPILMKTKNDVNQRVGFYLYLQWLLSF